MLPGDRLICAFVRTAEVSQQFRTWPLHVTIVPWFRLSASSETVAAGLAEALTTVGPFVAQADGMAEFGPNKRRPARLLVLPTPFTLIESKVRTYLRKKRALLIDETTKHRHEFRPHVTLQGDSELKSDETFSCDRLYIVEQQGDYKELGEEIRLGQGLRENKHEAAA